MNQIKNKEGLVTAIEANYSQGTDKLYVRIDFDKPLWPEHAKVKAKLFEAKLGVNYVAKKEQKMLKKKDRKEALLDAQHGITDHRDA